MRERLLVLGAGPGSLGLLQAARHRGLFVLAVDRDPLAPGFRVASRRVLFPAADELAVERLAAAEGVDGVIAPGGEALAPVAARVAARLGLPHPLAPEAAAAATVTARRRERLAAAGVPQPRFALCATLEEAAAAAGELGLPCVVKPADRSAQKGLALVRSPEELPGAAATALAASGTGRIVLEELVRGPELTVAAWSAGGRFQPLLVSEREPAPEAFGVALAHAWPPALDPAAAVEAARAAAAALGLAEGPSATRVAVGSDGPRVLEVAPALGAEQLAELVAAAVGVDVHALALAAALGEPVDEAAVRPRPRAGGACVRFLLAPPGILGGIEGVEAARAAPGVEHLALFRTLGEAVTPLARAADRAGVVVAVGDTAAEARGRAAHAADLVRFESVDVGALV